MPSRTSPEHPRQQAKQHPRPQRLGITTASAQNHLCRIRHRWLASTITNADAAAPSSTG
jgi:hypothetical protein